MLARVNIYTFIIGYCMQDEIIQNETDVDAAREDTLDAVVTQGAEQSASNANLAQSGDDGQEKLSAEVVDPEAIDGDFVIAKPEIVYH